MQKQYCFPVTMLADSSSFKGDDYGHFSSINGTNGSAATGPFFRRVPPAPALADQGGLDNRVHWQFGRLR
jgi:hypothetical protein